MKKNLKAIIAAAVAAVLVITAVLVLVVIKPFGKPTDYEHTIVFYSSQGAKLKTITENAIASFEEKYPGWKVLHTTVGGYDEVKDKINQDFQAQLQPDVAYCYADHVAYYLQTSNVVDLTKYLSSTEQVAGVTLGYTAEELADFVEGYYNEGLATNYADYDKYGYTATSMLTLPFVKSTELLYCNMTALETLGFEPAKTWDELWAQCEKIKKTYPTCTPLGYDSEANWFITACQQNGWGYTTTDENHYLFNNEGVKGWLTQLQEYYDLGYFTTEQDYGAYTSGLFTKGVEEGGLVYCIGSSGGASYQNTTKFKWQVEPTPGVKQENGTINNAAISQGPSLVMLSGGHKISNVEEKEKMTFLFMKELLDPKFQAAFCIESGYIPSRISTKEVELYDEHINGSSITAKAANVAASIFDRYFTSPAFKGSSNARSQVENVLLYAVTGEKPPEKALADAYKNCGGK